jgi:hypothetical protein
MPTYEFLHSIDDCKHEWEEVLSIKAPDPDHCPKCQAEGNIIRLISGGSGRGVVQLEGQDLVDKVKSDVQQLKREARNSEKIYANLVGERHYESLQQRIDRQKR